MSPLCVVSSSEISSLSFWLSALALPKFEALRMYWSPSTSSSVVAPRVRTMRMNPKMRSPPPSALEETARVRATIRLSPMCAAAAVTRHISVHAECTIVVGTVMATPPAATS